MGLCNLRLRLKNKPIQALQEAFDDEKLPEQFKDVYRIANPQQVELLSREMRVWDVDGNLKHRRLSLETLSSG